MATRKEVAELAGVSEATVSRVLNGVGPIKDATRERVMEAAARLGYQLNAVASSFARGLSGNIGVVLPHVPKVHLFSTYYFSEILSGIGEAVRTGGHGLLLLYRDPGQPFDYVSLFRTRRVDACLVLGASSLPDEEAGIRALAEEDVPFCVVDQRFGGLPVPAVIADHVSGSYVATRHLLASGHARIGFLNGSPQYSNSADRSQGYRMALTEEGIAWNEDIVYEGNYSRKSGYEAAARVAADFDRLDAVLCGNDRMAIGLVQGLKERGFRLPYDLPIVGYDNADASSLIDPPLTTVEVPFYEMGLRAASRLLSRLGGGAEDASAGLEVLPTRLVVRKSCKTSTPEAKESENE
ncbi:LacI family DNA-binding transcriptional regulator [Cohnella nanjingensis]|uniref:LacI family DNA-binding transcriptional regulator n=1 Tax=Cohnella nanjingensis TaxID=1387779 RepID=A0A7X0RWG3_9BACL|nr:LacI family DNA-binding transcriptional regulator [Cohnella nanjingensis]MBB6674922.1 LacI family DNA-binding transcriptional regulator [Cohnella nanjingensis]